MIHPRIDELMDQVDSRYALVIVAAKRARQINNYHHQLGEGTFDEFAPPLIQSLEELLDDGPRRDRRGQDRLRVHLHRDEVGHHSGMGRILLGVTGGIAAYKACELTRLLVKQGHEVIPLVTPGAQRFVAEETFLALARRPKSEDVYEHLTHADLLVVAPCTANTLSKLAYGIADNVLTEAALAHRGPMLVAPAMNPRMWAHSATRANAATIVARGVELVGPDEGEMAEGEWGVGRMTEPEEIAARVAQLLAPGSLAGRRVLVTAGGTREPVDSVRFVGNRSSGRMGVALAEEARRRGAEVVLLAANLSVDPPHGVETLPTPTADSMRDAALALGDVDVLLLAAAVADYRPAEVVAGKRAKDESGWTLELEPTDDIARALG